MFKFAAIAISAFVAFANAQNATNATTAAPIAVPIAVPIAAPQNATIAAPQNATAAAPQTGNGRLRNNRIDAPRNGTNSTFYMKNLTVSNLTDEDLPHDQ